LLVLAEMVETGVTIACPTSSFRIHFFQISNDFRSRAIQTVKIESIEPDLWRVFGPGVIVFVKPSDERFHVQVPPHPDRKSGESGKSLCRRCIIASAPDKAVEAVCIRPIRLY